MPVYIVTQAYLSTALVHHPLLLGLYRNNSHTDAVDLANGEERSR